MNIEKQTGVALRMTRQQKAAPGSSRGPELPGWWVSGLCAQTDPELFYPKESGGHAGPAKRVCAVCPVQQECLEDALLTNDQHGVRGGLTRRERQRLRRGAA